MGATSFVVGDVVQLKSGGPSMTIETVEANGLVVVVWYEKAKTTNMRDQFRAEMLVKAEPLGVF